MLVGLAATRCSVYTDSLLTEAKPVPDGGAGIGWWSGTGDQGCFSASYPTAKDRPGPQSATALPPIFVAIKTMRFGGQDPDGGDSETAWKDIGFDLDGKCTNSDTCLGDTNNPSLSCASTGAAVPYDGNYCRDNNFGRLEVTASTIPEVGGKYGLNDDAFNCALCVGDYNFVIRLSDYNGTDEDDHVRVDMYPSPGLDSPLPWNCANGEWKAHPCMTPDLPLNLEDDTVQAGTGNGGLPDATLFDDTAFVHEGYIVITLPPNSTFSFPGKRPGVATAFPTTFASGVVTGHVLRAQDGTWSIEDGIISGRVSEANIVKGLNLIGLCESDPNYTLVTNFLHTGLDVLEDGKVDPNRTCDSLSLALAFTAGQATAGKLVHVDPLVPCAADVDAGPDDAGTVTDSGTPVDSGTIVDSGSTVDAGDGG